MTIDRNQTPYCPDCISRGTLTRMKRNGTEQVRRLPTPSNCANDATGLCTEVCNYKANRFRGES